MLIWTVILAVLGGGVWFVSNIDTFEGGRVEGASIVAKTKHIRGLEGEDLLQAILGLRLRAVEFHSSALTLFSDGDYPEAFTEINNALECLRGYRLASQEALDKHGHMFTIVDRRDMEKKHKETKDEVLKTKEKILDAFGAEKRSIEAQKRDKADRERRLAKQAEQDRLRKEQDRKEHERRSAEMEKKMSAEKERRKNMTVKERMLEKGYKWVEGEGFVPVVGHVDELQNAVDERDKLMRQ